LAGPLTAGDRIAITIPYPTVNRERITCKAEDKNHLATLVSGMLVFEYAGPNRFTGNLVSVICYGGKISLA